MSEQSLMKRNLLSLATSQLRMAKEYMAELRTETFKPRVEFLQREIPRLRNDAFSNYKHAKNW